ncbi:MAG: NAD(P)-dependent oxidoreductase [Clostridia bacterium]
MRKVLVTGSGGYIGRHVVKALLDENFYVIAADINNDDVDARADKRTISIFDKDPDLFEKLGSPDICIHLAWRNGFVHNANSHILELSDHFYFLESLIKKGLKNLAVMGTMHEIGYFEGEINDDTPCNPLSYYGIAKNALRQSLLLLTEQNNVNLFWLRAYYILGDDIKNHSIFTKLIEANRNGQEKFPFTSGKSLFDFITVDELAKQISLASTQEEITGIINVCTGTPMSLKDRVEMFIKENSLKIQLDYGAFPDREYDSPGEWGNADKINRILKNSQNR